MKVHFNISILIAVFALALSSTFLTRAQEPSPTPAIESKESKKIACVRAWNYSYLADVPRLAVCLGPVGGKPPDFEKAFWIKRGMNSPKRTTWSDLPPGEYEVFAFKDDAVAGNMGTKIGPGIALPTSILSNRQGITIKPGSYQTILFTGENGKLTAQVITDNLPPGSSRKLRFYKFGTDVMPTISLITDKGDLRLLVAKVEKNEVSFPVTGAPAAQSYQVAFQNQDATIASLNLELDFSASSTCSIILAPNVYSKLGVELSVDAPYIALDATEP